MRLHLITCAAIAGLAGCGTDQLNQQSVEDDPGTTCVVGRTEPCACPGGTWGAQECLPRGVYGECRCEGDAGLDGGRLGGEDDGGRRYPGSDPNGDHGDTPDAAAPDAGQDAGPEPHPSGWWWECDPNSAEEYQGCKDTCIDCTLPVITNLFCSRGGPEIYGRCTFLCGNKNDPPGGMSGNTAWSLCEQWGGECLHVDDSSEYRYCVRP